MYREELKKIWKKDTVVLMVLISAVYFFALLLPPLRMLNHEGDSLAMERTIAEEWMEEYGSDIDLEEYRSIQRHYQDILQSAGDVIREIPVFAQCQVSSYEEYESYAQNAIDTVTKNTGRCGTRFRSGWHMIRSIWKCIRET